MPADQPKRLRRRTKGVPPLPIHLWSRFDEWFTAKDVRDFAAISDLPRMVADAEEIAGRLGDAINFAAASAGIAAATPKPDELLKWFDDVAKAADNLLAKLGLPPGLSGDPMAYRPNEATPWFARLRRSVSGDHLQRLHGLIAVSPLQALQAVPSSVGLLSELARKASQLEAELSPDPPHGNADVFRQELFLRLRTVFKFAFGVLPAALRDGERETPAIKWYKAVLKHAAERRQQVTEDADMAALDRLAEFKDETVGTYMQEAASRARKARKTGKG